VVLLPGWGGWRRFSLLLRDVSGGPIYASGVGFFFFFWGVGGDGVCMPRPCWRSFPPKGRRRPAPGVVRVFPLLLPLKKFFFP